MTLPGCTLTKPAVARPQIWFLSSFFSLSRFLGCFFFFKGGCGSPLSPVRGSIEAPGLGIRLCVREKGHLRAVEVSTNVGRQSSSGPQLKSELHRVRPATG